MSTFINPTELDLKEETVVCINRVSKATTGGRAMRFNSVVVVGDGSGHVGVGFGNPSRKFNVDLPCCSRGRKCSFLPPTR